MSRFEGRVAIVTGGAHGIGEATVRRLASERASVAVVDVDREGIERLVEELRADGAQAEGHAVDVRDPDAVATMAGAVAERWDRIDVLHNNAGVLAPGAAHELELDDWDRTLDVNLGGVLHCTRAVLPAMMEREVGAIVNTGSVGGLFGVAALAAYTASKAAVVNLTRQLALDYAARGIRVNCVCPGWVDTGFNQPLLGDIPPQQVTSQVARAVPAGRQARASEIASAVAFLASDDASYITGQCLVVDGGMTAATSPVE